MSSRHETGVPGFLGQHVRWRTKRHLDDRPAAGRDHAAQPKPRSGEQVAELRLGPLAPGQQHEQVEVEPRGKSRLVGWSDDELNHQGLPVVGDGPAAVAQDSDGILVGPIVEDVAQQVGRVAELLDDAVAGQ